MNGGIVLGEDIFKKTKKTLSELYELCHHVDVDDAGSLFAKLMELDEMLRKGKVSLCCTYGETNSNFNGGDNLREIDGRICHITEAIGVGENKWRQQECHGYSPYLHAHFENGGRFWGYAEYSFILGEKAFHLEWGRDRELEAWKDLPAKQKEYDDLIAAKEMHQLLHVLWSKRKEGPKKVSAEELIKTWKFNREMIWTINY